MCPAIHTLTPFLPLPLTPSPLQTWMPVLGAMLLAVHSPPPTLLPPHTLTSTDMDASPGCHVASSTFPSSYPPAPSPSHPHLYRHGRIPGCHVAVHSPPPTLLPPPPHTLTSTDMDAFLGAMLLYIPLPSTIMRLLRAVLLADTVDSRASISCCRQSSSSLMQSSLSTICMR